MINDERNYFVQTELSETGTLLSAINGINLGTISLEVEVSDGNGDLLGWIGLFDGKYVFQASE